jgi:hypothetical protein
MPRYQTLLLACAILVLASLGLTARAADNTQQPVQRLIVYPQHIELDASYRQHRLLVSAVDAAGRATDVTTQAEFKTARPDVVEVAAGQCQARGDGTAEVTVSYGGRSASIQVICRNVADKTAPSFVEDVVPLFTRLGCNQGSCHGKNDGRNGFKLSLRGYAPDWDYERLMRESRGRRLRPALPQESLLLKKVSGGLPHGGGVLATTDSRAYEVLCDWLRAGAPGPIAEEARLESLELVPGDLTLPVGGKRQLLLCAKYSDGRTRDVTWLAQFASIDSSLVEVSPAGNLQMLRSGETAVRAHFESLVAVITVSSPFEKTVDPQQYAARNNLIDEYVLAKLAALRIPPSPPASDAEFVRRVYLDTIGTLPTPEEAAAFTADTSAGKRSALVEHLLARPEFVDYWTLEWADLLQNRKDRDGDNRTAKGVRSFYRWLHEQVAANRPWDELVRAVVTASGKVNEHPEVGYFVTTIGTSSPADSDAVASVAQAFLGTRIGCAKCHNHPLEKFTQDDYYHFAAYFAPVKLERKHPLQGGSILSFTPQKPDQKIGVGQPRTGKFMEPQPLDRQPTHVDPAADPRLQLAAWITDPKNESFSGAIVNRIWRHYMGVGLVEPVDDLRASNPPSNQPLMQALSKELVEHHYDLKHLMRLVLNSRSYQLSSATVPGNQTDTRFYSHYYARRLDAEVLLDAISQVTGRPENFPGYPVGIRAIQVPDPSVDSYFLKQFGRSERVTACACERRGEVTIAQLLQLENGEAVLGKIQHGEGRLNALLARETDDSRVLDELFASTLGHEPDATARSAVQTALSAGVPRAELFADVFWALLNSKDFTFNH